MRDSGKKLWMWIKSHSEQSGYAAISPQYQQQETHNNPLKNKF